MFQNKTVALVATGGGGRSLAHAGVIQACLDAGIEFDLMIGASSGAIATIFYSQYKNTDKILDYFRPKNKKHYGLPSFSWGTMMNFKHFFDRNIINGLFDLRYAESFFKKHLPVNNFNELPIPTYITATNLDTKDGVLFGPGTNDRVPISKALVASCCIPVLFRPVEINGEYYVDGEIRRPASAIETVIHLGADIVIVSDIYGKSIKNIAKSGMLNIAAEVVNMMLEDRSLRGLRTYRTKYPNKKIITIEPELANIPTFFNTKNYDRLFEEGYRAAQDIGERLK